MRGCHGVFGRVLVVAGGRGALSMEWSIKAFHASAAIFAAACASVFAVACALVAAVAAWAC